VLKVPLNSNQSVVTAIDILWNYPPVVKAIDSVGSSVSFSSGLSPKGATLFPDRGSYEYDQIRVSVCLLCLVVSVY